MAGEILSSSLRTRASAMKKKLAEWFLGEIPQNYPTDRLEGPQGFKKVRKQLEDEDRREVIVDGLRSRAYPSGLIVRGLRRGIVWLNYARIQVWIEEARDRMAFDVLHRDHRSLEEIATWRDHYHLLRFGYFALNLLVLPSLPSALRIALYFLNFLSGLLILDMLGGLAGAALVWYQKSVSTERTFVHSLVDYAEVILAFAGFYRVCGCLNAPNPDVLQALYFSTVAATTVGFGDIIPLNSTGVDAAGAHVPVSRLGLFLVIAQLALFVLFVLVFVNIFLGRSLNPHEQQKTGETRANGGNDA